MPPIEALQSLANDISAGFEALLERLEEQKKIEADLRQRLAKVAERYNSNSSDNPSDVAFSEWQDEIVKQISTSPLEPEVTRSHEIERANAAIRSLQSDMAARKCPIKHNAPAQPVSLQCPVKAPFEEMEKDFTTQGKASSLACPFASKIPHGDAAEDPIAAEFHADSLSAQSIDAARACGRCPIRFLDKHSPEEIAQYFEKHKHELPRSHEICVKRYQANETSIRQLDAKYGNLVSMIQGLGNKHKQYLPEQGGSTSEQKSTAAVATWADGIDADVAEVDMEDEQRLSHFEKPLREVRVGESPSRPWGIHVPGHQPKAPSAVSSQQDRRTPPPKGVTEVVPEASSKRAPSALSSRRSRPPNQIIFNGPVFLGYSPEQAAQFLSQLGVGQQED